MGTTVSIGGNIVYVVNRGSNTVSVINHNMNTVIATFKTDIQ
ncbi:TPA: hypothetical protein ACGCM8_005491 [Bacillus cereus]